MLSRFAIVVLLSIAVPPLRASDRSVEITPLLGLRGGATLDSNRAAEEKAEADAAPSVGLAVDFRVRPDARVEVFLDRQVLEFDADPVLFGAERFDLTIDYLHAGGVYEPPGRRARPFVSAALGLTRFDPDGASVDDSLSLSGSLAGGVKIPMGARLSLRLEARAYASFSDLSIQASCGPGCVVNLAAGGWYQVAGRIGLAIRLSREVPPGRGGSEGLGRSPRPGVEQRNQTLPACAFAPSICWITR